MSTYHKYECRIAPSLERTQLHRLPLVMASLRAITQKSVEFFLSLDAQGAFDQHDIKHGTQADFLYKSDDYRNLFNLVTHNDRRSPYDVVTKHIIAGILVAALKGVGYFSSIDKENEKGEAFILIGKCI